MRKLFADTMVLAYAIGDESPHRSACRAILSAVAAGDVELSVSAEALQELLFHRLRRTDRLTALAQSRGVAASCVVLAVDEDIIDRMLDLVERTAIRGRDAVHAAVALSAGFTEIVSTDPVFDGIDGLRRVDPGDALNE